MDDWILTEFMLIGSRRRLAALEETKTLRLNDAVSQQVHSLKCLGVNIDQNLSWDSHITCIRKKSNSQRRYSKKGLTCLKQAKLNCYL